VRPLTETVILRGGCLRRQKLMQNMLVVGDYFAEQAGFGLTQKVVERRQLIISILQRPEIVGKHFPADE